VFKNKKYSKSQKRSLLSSIKRGGTAGQSAIETIYKDYRYMAYLNKLSQDYGLNMTDMVDLFHDAIVIFRRKVRRNEYDSNIQIHIYLTSVVKNLIQNKKRVKRTSEFSEEMEAIHGAEESVAEYYNRKEAVEKVNELLELITPKCRKLLGLWQQGYNFTEIAEEARFGLRRKG